MSFWKYYPYYHMSSDTCDNMDESYERSKIQKSTYCRTLVYEILERVKPKEVSGCQQADGKAGTEWKGKQVNFQKDENIPSHD